jgi:hypothetical protein
VKLPLCFPWNVPLGSRLTLFRPSQTSERGKLNALLLLIVPDPWPSTMFGNRPQRGSRRGCPMASGCSRRCSCRQPENLVPGAIRLWAGPVWPEIDLWGPGPGCSFAIKLLAPARASPSRMIGRCCHSQSMQRNDIGLPGRPFGRQTGCHRMTADVSWMDRWRYRSWAATLFS